MSPDPRVWEPVTLTITVENRGTLDFEGVSLELYLAVGDMKWEEKSAQRTITLRAGESCRISTGWTPTSAHDYVAQLTISPHHEPFTSNLANNTRKTVVRVRANR